jgi:hypothetical protein
MLSNEYFDTRSLARAIPGECPVRGCKASLESASQGQSIPQRCPDHQIKIHTSTFGYSNPLRNIRFEPEYFKRNILGNPAKAETHRLGYENSEDALTWNVFARLAKTDRLTEFASSLAQLDLKGPPDLYLWGLSINFDSVAIAKPFLTLIDARRQFESDISRMQTEPDVILHFPGQCLIVIEAKFMSGNTIAEDDAGDVVHEKPKSQKGVISRYAVNGRPPSPLHIDRAATPFFSQLYRNLVFAIWMARELKIEWRLVNLVSELHQRDRPDPTQFINSLLPAAYQKHFVLYEWEQLFRDQVLGRPELDGLADYLHYKSGNCVQGLAI